MHRGQKKYPDSHKVNHHLFYANQDTFPLPVQTTASYGIPWV